MRATWILALLAAVAACDDDKPKPEVAPSAPPAPSVAPEPKLPPQVGHWKATLTLEPTSIALDRKHGGVRAWEDAGKAATGAAELTVDIEEDGRASGTLTGAAGKLRAEGRFEDGVVRLRLTSEEPSATSFAGIVTAKLDREKLTGTLQISSGDSHHIRKADVVLQK